MDSVKRLLRKFNKEHVRWRRLRKVILSLSCVVTFIVTYALILPALTLDNQSATTEEGVYLDADGGTLTAQGDTYSVTVSYGAEAEIPEDATLETHEITQDDPAYQTYFEQAAQAVKADGTLPSARFFDISIIYDGNEIEPAEPVDVTVSLDEPMTVTEDQEVMVVHFAENDGEEKPELLDIKDSDLNDESVSEVSFEQSGFSVVGTVVAPVSGGWPESTDAQVMVIKAADDNYYAVKQDGSLLGVEYSNDEVTFPSSISSTDDLSSYLWELSGSGDTRKISGGGNYISAYYDAGKTSTDNYTDQHRDTDGHIYYTTLSNNYLTTNSEYTAIAGRGDSSNAAVVYFVSSFTTGTTSSWTEENGTKYMVVTADNSSYYAVKNDGSLVPVTIQSSSGAQTVIFGSTTGVTTDGLADFQWTLAAGTDDLTRSLSSVNALSSGTTAYLSPSVDSGIASEAVDLYKDSVGHIYTQDSEGDTPYHYLKMNGTSAVAGSSTGTSSVSEVSADACAVALYSAASIGSSGSGSGSLTSPEPLGAPDTSKTLTDNGDGTYELALSVTGKTSSLAEDVKADVYIILDTSYSMVENTVSTGETRFAVAKQAVITAGDALLGQNGKTLSSGGTIPSDAVQVSLITFNNKAEAKTFGSSKCTSSKTSFESTAGGISAPSSFTGTNWEDAFTKTAEVMSEVGRSDAQPYVIFVSDGNPTFRNTLGDYYTNQTYYLDSSYDGWVHTSSLGNSMVNDGYAVSLGRTIKPYSTENTGGTSVTVTFETTGTNAFIPDTRPDMSETSGLYGTGLDDYNWAQLNENDGNYYAVDVNTNITRCYDNAKDNARSLATNYDAEFYSIRAFGSADRMNSITRYVVTGSDTGDLPADRAFDATSKDELTAAFDSIVNQILVELMYTNVTIADGLTGLTNAEAKVGDVLSEPDFRYYKYGGSYGTADNPTDITDEVNTDWPEANRAKYDSTTGAVTWNVCSSTKPDGTDVAWADIDDYDYYRLEDGVTYVVKFRVWPDQEAYDTLTSIHNAGSTARDTAYGNLSDELKNKIYKNSDGEYVAKTDYASDQDVIDALQTIETAGETAEDTAYNNLDDTIKSQIYKDTDGNYRLYTNTDASVSYDVLKRTIEEPDTGETGLSIVDSGSDTLTNPEGMILTDTTMKVYKVWEGDTAVNRPSFITLYIYEGTGSAGTDEHLYQTITLPNPNTGADTWEYTIYISPALKITDTSGTPDSEGNYPVITLDQGHTYRVGEVESSTIYQFEGETVYPYLLDSSTVVTTNGKNSQGLTATNTIRKTSIIIKKANDAESLTSEDFKYLDNAHFKLLRKVVTGTGSDGYPEYQYESYPVLDSEGNTTYPYDDFEIADGETGVTFTNLPVGEYKLVELSAPDGYVIVDKEIFFKVTWTDAGGTLVLDKYVAKTGYEDDTDVRAAIAAIYAAGTAAEQNVYNNLSDETKNKIEIDGYGEYVAKSGYESDTDVIAALTEMYTARETAKDEYYNGLSDAIKANIYVSSDVIFTSSAENGTNDIMIVKNTAGAPLPNTGSRGTIIVIILGSALIIFAVLSMAARKLRSSVSGK